MTRILFVDDEKRVLDGLRRLLYSRRKCWELQFAESGADALALLAAQPCDVVVTDMRMPSMDGAELLGHVQALKPQVLRVVLSGYTELEAAVRAAPVAHQFLAKPCDASELIATLERMVALRQSTEPELIRAIGAIRPLPTTAAHHVELTHLLTSPLTSLDEVGDLIERDVALAAQVLHLVSSAFFGHPDPQATIRNAVALLGLQVLRDLFHTGALCSPPSSAQAARIELHNRHAVCVARLSQLMTEDVVAGGHAAGLLHDVGAWLDEDDKDSADRGYALLAFWGVPAPILDVVQHKRGLTLTERSPLAQAVMTAERLTCAYEQREAAPALDEIERGWCARIPDWRERLEGGAS